MVNTRFSTWLCWCLALVASAGLAKASETDFSLLVRIERDAGGVPLTVPDTNWTYCGAPLVYANHYGFRVSNIVPGVEYLHIAAPSTSHRDSIPGNIAARAVFVFNSADNTLTVTGYAWYKHDPSSTYFREDFARVLQGAPGPRPRGQGGEVVIELHDDGTKSSSVTVNQSTTQPSTQPALDAENNLDDLDIAVERQEAISPPVTGEFPSLGAALAALTTSLGIGSLLETTIVPGIGLAQLFNELSSSHATVTAFFTSLGSVWAAVKTVFAAACYLLCGWVAFHWVFDAMGIVSGGDK